MMNYEIFKEVEKEKFMDYMPEKFKGMAVSYTHLDVYKRQEDGDLILPEALQIGNYRIEEIKAPFGYVVNDNYINISVDTDTAFETDGDTNDAIITVEYSDAPAVCLLYTSGIVFDVISGIKCVLATIKRVLCVRVLLYARYIRFLSCILNRS